MKNTFKNTFIVMVAFEVQADNLLQAETQVEYFVQNGIVDSLRSSNWLDIYLPACEHDNEGQQRVFYAPADAQEEEK